LKTILYSVQTIAFGELRGSVDFHQGAGRVISGIDRSNVVAAMDGYND
jgi:hypothetical protein